MRLALIGGAVVLCAVAVGLHTARHHRPHLRPPQPVAQVVRAENPVGPIRPRSRPERVQPVAQVVGDDNVCPARNVIPPPAPPVAQVVNLENTPKDHTWTVEGWGKTEADAEQVALDKACAKVGDFLKHQDPPIQWHPSRDFVDRNLVKERKPEAKELPDLGQMYRVSYEVKLEPKYYREILEYDRQDRAEQRHILLAKVVGALLAVLLAVFGYFRLEEMTRGYYTLWLRLGALALIGVAGALLLIVA